MDSAAKKSKKEKTMIIAVAQDQSESSGSLPVAVCWNHAAERGIDGIRGTESADAAITIEKYIPGKYVTAGAADALLHKRRDEEEHHENSISKHDPFENLLTTPARKHYPGSLACTAGIMHFEGNSHLTMSASTLLGIYDSSSRELKIVPFGDVFTHMKIQRPNVENVEEKSRQESPISPTSKTISTFSSKAKRRRHDERVSSAQMIRQNTEQLLNHDDEDDISQLLNEGKEGDVDLRSGEGIRPTPCLDASTPELLYKWSEIIPDKVVTDLLPLAEEISDIVDNSFEEWRSKKLFCQCALRLLKLLPKDVPDRKVRIAKILLIEYLFFMYNKPIKPLPEQAPRTVADYLRKEFTKPSMTAAKHRMINPKGKNKILAHLLLILLNLEDYTSDVTTLLADMPGRERKTFQHLTSIIGARFSESFQKTGDKFSVSMSHPWNFPKNLAGSPRKRKR
ncbi:uncharacterized protein LOC129586231 isoform X2 [Paramacrobiotus metropolitanus]|uniref:uncharacterized protein LOC129586231 isoform X2 n=1 Tax=Paramacrobiotus metropolitanus TaxID=2943436 RepID=UPI00244598CE|nr:uncharacterized protein LOC129586231 isoform X2 [Paramacrobiotus metropolitanus]